MALPKTLLLTSAIVLLSLSIAGLTLPYWLSSALNLTPYSSSIEIVSPHWKKPLQLHIDALHYQQDNIEIHSNNILLTWSELMDFSLSALNIEIDELHVVYQNIDAEAQNQQKGTIDLPSPKELPNIHIASIKTTLNQNSIPITANLNYQNHHQYPVHINFSHQSQKLGMIKANWKGEVATASIWLEGMQVSQVLNKLLPLFSDNYEVEEIRLIGDIEAELTANLLSQESSLQISIPQGQVHHETLNVSWDKTWTIDIEAINKQWKMGLAQDTYWSIGGLHSIYSQFDWPSIIQKEYLPESIDVKAQQGTYMNSLQQLTGNVTIDAEGTIVSLISLYASPDEQKSQWQFNANSPPWLDLKAESHIEATGDFFHNEQWILNATPTLTMNNLQIEGTRCQSLISEATEIMRLTFEGDSMSSLSGKLSTTIEQCEHNELNVDKLIVNTNIINPHYTDLAFEWPSHLSSQAIINRKESIVSVKINAKSESTNTLLHSLTNDLSSLAANGETALESDIVIDLNKLNSATGSWQVSFSGQGQYDDIQADGIEVKLNGELNKKTIHVHPSSFIKLNSIDPGVPISSLSGQLSGQLAADNIALSLSGINGKLLEGRLAIDNIALKPEASGAALLTLDSIALDALAQLQSQPGIKLQGLISGRFPINFDSSGVHIEQGEFYNITPGFIQIKDNPEVQSLKASSEQAAQALNLLENLDFETLTSTVNFAPTGDVTLAVSIEGRNPDIGQAINFNYTHEENLYQLMQSLRLGDKLTEKIQQQYQENSQ